MYFNYHAKVKKLVDGGHCVGFKFVESYHGISPCLLLFFDDGSKLPIRRPRFDEYRFLLLKKDVPEITD